MPFWVMLAVCGIDGDGAQRAQERVSGVGVGDLSSDTEKSHRDASSFVWRDYRGYAETHTPPSH